MEQPDRDSLGGVRDARTDVVRAGRKGGRRRGGRWAAVAMGVTVSTIACIAHADDAPPLPAATPDAAPMSAADAARVKVRVHIESPEEVELEAQSGGDWETVCTSPCDKDLPVGDFYRINGSGVRSSAGFRLRPGQPLRVDVEPHSSTGHAFAIVITVLGGVGLVPIATVTAGVAVVFLTSAVFICPFVALFKADTYPGCVGTVTGYATKYYAEPIVWAPALAGVAMVVAGGVWLTQTPPTGANVSPQSPAPPPNAPTQQPILWRRPEWRPDPLLAAGISSSAVDVPIVRINF